MEGLTIVHLLTVLRCALRMALTREPHLRTMCGPFWSQNLESLSLDLLLKKLRFLFLHCTANTLSAFFQVGLLRNKRVLAIAVEIIGIRNEENHPLLRKLIHRSCKYTLSCIC